MKKIIITTVLFLTGLTSGLNAQNLEVKIPKDVNVVVASNAENIFELISISDIDNNKIGKETLKDFNRKKENKATSVVDLGFDIKSNAYYFYKNTDSINYHAFFVELNNRKSYEEILSKRDLGKIETKNGYSFIKGYSDLTIWNDECFLMVKGEAFLDYFENNKDLYDGLEKEDVDRYDFLDKIEDKWELEYAVNIIENRFKKSLKENKKFQKAKKKNASATIWVENYGMLMSSFMSSYSGLILSSMGANATEQDLYGVNEVVANLYFEEDNINVKVDMSIDSEMKKAFKKMYNSKMSSNLLTNFESNKALAYLSLSVNTEEVLVQYPALIKKMYGGLVPFMEEEIGVGADLFSLVIDEKAIGDLVTGDALFVLDDLSKKEVEYTSYEYDEDYKRTETIKTKEEVLPDFTFMIGTKEDELLNRMFMLGVKHKELSFVDEKIYEISKSSSDLPFKVFALIKNNVLYFTSSKTKALKIYNNNGSNITTEHTKRVQKNSFVTYFDIRNTMNGFTDLSLSRNEERIYSFMKNNLTDVYLIGSKIKGNKISSELKLNTSKRQENSLKLLLDVFDNIR